MQHLPSEIILHHILPFVNGCYRVVISMANTCSQLRNKFKQFSLTLQLDDGRKCFQTINFVTDEATSVEEWSLEVDHGFIAVLESGLFSRVCVNFKWVKLSEWMVNLLTKEKLCLDMISQMDVFDCCEKVETMILNANWKQLSSIKFANVKNIVDPFAKSQKQIVDFRKLAKLEVFESNQKFKFEIPNKPIVNASNLRELSLSNQSNGFIAKLFRHLRFPNIEKLELKRCDLYRVNFSSIRGFNNLKSLKIDSKLSEKQYFDIFQNEKLANLENLELIINNYQVLQKFCETSVFLKSLTRLVVKDNIDYYYYSNQFWKDIDVWKLISRENFPKLKQLSIAILDLSVQQFNGSKLELDSLEVFDMNYSELRDDWSTFKSLTHLKMEHSNGSALPLHLLTNLKSLCLRDVTHGSAQLILDLPKLERLELKGCGEIVFSCKEYPNLKYISIENGGTLCETVDAICKTSSPLLETFVFRRRWYYDDVSDNDLAMETISEHANFSKLKELQLDGRFFDDAVEILATSQLDLDYLVLNSPFLSCNAAYELCDGSIQCKLMQLRFKTLVEERIFTFTGTIPNLIQILIRQENEECNADIIAPNDEECYYFQIFGPSCLFYKYEDITDVFGREIVSELNLNDLKKKKIKSDRKKSTIRY